MNFWINFPWRDIQIVMFTQIETYYISNITTVIWSYCSISQIHTVSIDLLKTILGTLKYSDSYLAMWTLLWLVILLTWYQTLMWVVNTSLSAITCVCGDKPPSKPYTWIMNIIKVLSWWLLLLENALIHMLEHTIGGRTLCCVPLGRIWCIVFVVTSLVYWELVYNILLQT